MLRSVDFLGPLFPGENRDRKSARRGTRERLPVKENYSQTNTWLCLSTYQGTETAGSGAWMCAGKFQRIGTTLRSEVGWWAESLSAYYRMWNSNLRSYNFILYYISNCFVDFYCGQRKMFSNCKFRLCLCLLATQRFGVIYRVSYVSE